MPSDLREENVFTLGNSFPASPWCAALIIDKVWAGEEDGTIGIRALNNGREEHYIPRKTHCNVTQVTAVSPTQAWAALSDGCIRVYNAQNRKLIRQLSRHQGTIHCMELFAGYVFTGGADSMIQQWDVATCEPVQVYDGHSDEVRCLTFAKLQLNAEECPVLLSGSSDRTIRLWAIGQQEDLETEVCIQILQGHSGAVRCLAVVEGCRLWSGGDDGCIFVWDLHTFEMLEALDRHGCPVMSLIPMPDGSVWSAGKNGEILQWSGQTQELLQTVTSMPARLNSLKAVAVTHSYKFWACLANGTVVPFDVDLALPASNPQCLENSLDQTNDQLVSELNSTLTESLRSVSSPQRGIGSPYRTSQPQCQKLTTELEELRQELEREKQRTSQEHVMGDLARAEAIRLDGEVKNLRMEIQTLVEERDDWRAKVTTTASSSATAAAGNPNDNPVNRLFVVQQEAMSLRRRVQELQAQQTTEVARHKATVEDLQKQLARQMEFVRAAEKRSAEAEVEVQKLLQKVDGAHRDAEVKCAALRQQASKWTTKCAELEGELVARTGEIQALQRRLTQLEDELNEARAAQHTASDNQEQMDHAISASIEHIRELFPQLPVAPPTGHAIGELSELVTVLCEDRLQIEEVAVDLAQILMEHCHMNPEEGLVTNLQTACDAVAFLAHCYSPPVSASRRVSADPPAASPHISMRRPERQHQTPNNKSNRSIPGHQPVRSPSQSASPASGDRQSRQPVKANGNSSSRLPPHVSSPSRSRSPKRDSSASQESLPPRSPSPKKMSPSSAFLEVDSGLIRGTVTQWLDTQQYGYVRPDSRQGVKDRILVDASVLPPSLSSLTPGQRVFCILVPFKATEAPIAHSVLTQELMKDGTIDAVVQRWHTPLQTGILRPLPGQWLRESESITVESGVVPSDIDLQEGDTLQCVIRPPRLVGGTQWWVAKIVPNTIRCGAASPNHSTRRPDLAASKSARTSSSRAAGNDGFKRYPVGMNSSNSPMASSCLDQMPSARQAHSDGPRFFHVSPPGVHHTRSPY